MLARPTATQFLTKKTQKKPVVHLRTLRKSAIKINCPNTNKSVISSMCASEEIFLGNDKQCLAL